MQIQRKSSDLQLIASLVLTLILSLPVNAKDDSSLTGSSAKASADNINQTLNTMIERYQAAIEDIESKEGAYSTKLAQQLSNLGDIYQRYGQHKQAVDAFKRSLHLNRINDGLYSMTQVPLVQRTITSLKALKKWRDVNERYGYLYWLYSQNYESTDLKMLPLYIEMGKWALDSYSLGYSEYPSVDLINASVLFSRAEDLTIEHFGDKDPKLAEILQHEMIANYFIATYRKMDVNELNAQMGYVPAYSSETRILYLQSRSYKNGLAILNKELQLYENQPVPDPVQIAKVKIRMADWSLLFEKRKAAMTQYQQAYQYVVKHDPSDTYVNQFFSQPVALPDLPNMAKQSQINLDPNQIAAGVTYVHASFDVTRNGKARNIKVVEVSPDQNIDSAQSKLVRTLRVAKFRPRIENGNAIKAQQVQLHYFPQH